jgi:hypothetical protein
MSKAAAKMADIGIPQCCSPNMGEPAIILNFSFMDVFQGMGGSGGSSSSSRNNKAFDTYRVLVDIFVVGLLCMIGFVGNGLTIIILRSDRDKNSTTNWLLQSLAVVDILYLVACVFIQPIKAVHDLTSADSAVGTVNGSSPSWTSAVGHALHRSFIHVEPYVWTLASVAETITIWIVLLVTVDRFIAICMPLRSKMRTMARARAAVVVVVVLAVLYNVPMLFERRVVERQVDGNVIVDVTELRRNTWYFVIYKTVCYFVFRKIGPLLVLIGLNVRLMRALREMRRRHRYLTRRHRQRENVTLTLVVVVSVFIVCELPDVCLRVAVTVKEFDLHGEPFDAEALIYGAQPATNALLTLNSAINFFIYCLIGHKFRHIMIRMLQSACEGRPIGTVLVGNVSAGAAGGGSGSCCGCRSATADCRRADNADDDAASENGFATPPPSMMTRSSIAMTTTNTVIHVGNVCGGLRPYGQSFFNNLTCQIQCVT